MSEVRGQNQEEEFEEKDMKALIHVAFLYQRFRLVEVVSCIVLLDCYFIPLRLLSFCSSILSHKMLYFAFSWHAYREPFNSHSLHKCCCWPCSSLYDHTGPSFQQRNDTKLKSSSTSYMKVSCTVHKNGFHSPLNEAFFWMQGTKHWRWPPPKIFFSSSSHLTEELL